MVFAPSDVFEQIIKKEIPADIVIETDTVIAFHDINPKAKIHILIVPKTNYTTLNEIRQDNISDFGELFLMAKQIAEIENLEGYKLHMNVGEKGGQVVPHVHLHLLSKDFKCEL
jgi:histidine triad (HIT) family protein